MVKNLASDFTSGLRMRGTGATSSVSPRAPSSGNYNTVNMIGWSSRNAPANAPDPHSYAARGDKVELAAFPKRLEHHHSSNMHYQPKPQWSYPKLDHGSASDAQHAVPPAANQTNRLQSHPQSQGWQSLQRYPGYLPSQPLQADPPHQHYSQSFYSQHPPPHLQDHSLQTPTVSSGSAQRHDPQTAPLFLENIAYQSYQHTPPYRRHLDGDRFRRPSPYSGSYLHSLDQMAAKDRAGSCTSTHPASAGPSLMRPDTDRARPAHQTHKPKAPYVPLGEGSAALQQAVLETAVKMIKENPEWHSLDSKAIKQDIYFRGSTRLTAKDKKSIDYSHTRFYQGITKQRGKKTSRKWHDAIARFKVPFKVRSNGVKYVVRFLEIKDLGDDKPSLYRVVAVTMDANRLITNKLFLGQLVVQDRFAYKAKLDATPP